jgi:DNA-binding LytR/AlgR family response regulator
VINLSGRRILVVEDSFYLAMDVARTIRDAEGEVVGPFHSAQDALKALAQSPPDSAVLDVNLGEGASFDVAYALNARSIPFVFFTGYDQSAIPGEFANVPRLEKPVANSRIVEMLHRQRPAH